MLNDRSMCVISPYCRKDIFMDKTKPRQETADKILKAATDVFVEKGFEGASINDIANKAKINKSLIYHHFKDKENLWQEVKINLFEQYTQAGISSLEISSDLPFQEFLSQVLTQRFHFYKDNPSIARLVTWQNLEAVGKQVKGIGNPKLTSLASQIEDYQRRGEVRQELNPEMVSYMVLYSASSPFIETPPFFNEVNEEKNQEGYLKMMIEALYLAFTTHPPQKNLSPL